MTTTTLSFEEVINFLLTISLWDVMKLMYCLVFLFYIFFSIVVLKQIRLMTETLKGQLELSLKLFGTLNLFLAIFLFAAALLIL